MGGHRPIAVVSLLCVALGSCQVALPSTPMTSSPATPAATDGETTESPIGADCTSLHWYDVRSALEATDHYTYRSVDHIVEELPTAESATLPPVVLDRVASGAYVAPDRMSEVSTWTSVDPAPSGVPFWGLIPLDYPDFIQIGTQGWERIPLADPRWHAGRRVPDARGGHVRSILMNLAAVAHWSDGRRDPSASSECLFTVASVAADDGTRFDASMWADPSTALPSHLHIDRVGRGGTVSHFDTSIDTTTAATIEPPAANELAASSTP